MKTTRLSPPRPAARRAAKSRTASVPDARPPAAARPERGEAAMACSAAGLRLNKALALAGIASRRGADELVRQGRVTINNEPVTEPGARINPAADRVGVDGREITLPAGGEYTYLMLHKPVQVVSTVKDPQGRPTVLDFVPVRFRGKRLFPVGRLDYFSEGLLLLTDDGEMTLRLTHPRYHLPKVYHVRVKERPSPAALETMRRGMTLAEGEKLAPVQLRILPGFDPVMEITLHQGINRQIRRMCRDLGLTILSLRRVRSGPLDLGDLPRGKARELTANEIAALRGAVDL